MKRDLREVWLVRHGETEWNVEGRRQGQLDSPLTENGRAHALSMADRLADASQEIDAVFTSPLGRARATAEPIALALGLPIVAIDELREIDHGSFAGHTAAEIDRRWPGAMGERSRDKFAWRFPGGESYSDGLVRVEAALGRIAGASTRPLLVAHEMISRMIQLETLGLSPTAALERSLSHGTILQIDVAARSAIEL